MKEKLIAILKEKIEMYQNDIDHYVNNIRNHPDEEKNVAVMAQNMDRLRVRQGECELIIWHIENLKTE
jgi:conjugal transfer/entry exclusion protein